MNRSRLRVGVVVSRFNSEVTSLLEEGAMAALRDAGINGDQIHLVRVPGALEIPLAAQVLLEEGSDAVLALGAVIRGETAHFDYVCLGVERGCSELQLRYQRPVAFGVLTTDTEEQALARCGGAHGHKGREAAEVALEMVEVIEGIRARSR